jgi:uncharacterized RDD family membrane protein YckC
MDRDSMNLVTPEGLTLELTLAGIGSRSIACIIDTLIQLFLVIVAAELTPTGSGGLVFFSVAAVAIIFGYHVYFETRGGGATPGKRMAHLRVIRSDGGPVGFVASFIRTVLRIVDVLPGTYTVGLVAVFVTSRNQRLGDLAAGTVVVRDAPVRRDDEFPPIPEEEFDPSDPLLGDWDTTAVTLEEIGVIRQFLERRHELAIDSRMRLARNLAASLDGKVVRPPRKMRDERLLELIVAEKARHQP